jgi:F0F1-type ATP synthase assembly protein I
MREAMKWIALSTELPIMVGLFAYIGQRIGKKYGPEAEMLGILIGGLLGFILGIISIFLAVGVFSPRKETVPSDSHANSAC